MLLLIILLCCIVIYLDCKYWDLSIVTLVGSVIGVLALICFLTFLLIYPYRVSERLEMYEEENIKIESKIKNVVNTYIDYEQETYNNLVKDYDLETLLVVYPDLNSNELVRSEIEVYVENNNQIKDLKEQKILRPTFRWWLYFGK